MLIVFYCVCKHSYVQLDKEQTSGFQEGNITIFGFNKTLKPPHTFILKLHLKENVINGLRKGMYSVAITSVVI